MKRIGTVEILRQRIYALDPEVHSDGPQSTVIVEPGHFWVYTDGLSTFWMMRGQLNQRGVYRMGDGMFTLSESDAPSGIEVSFPSRRFGPDEWADLIRSPQFTEGPDQRLKLTLVDAGEVEVADA